MEYTQIFFFVVVGDALAKIVKLVHHKFDQKSSFRLSKRKDFKRRNTCISLYSFAKDCGTPCTWMCLPDVKIIGHRYTYFGTFYHPSIYQICWQ